MTFDRGRPFNDLPDLPPTPDVATKSVLRNCMAAHDALAELHVATRRIPNPAILMNSIPLLEAQASSRIENIVTSTDRLFLYANAALGQADPATQETLCHHIALSRGLEMLKQRPVSTVMAVEVCRTIKAVGLDIRSTPGTALVNSATSEVIYTPPVGEAVLRRKLSNWERYIHEFEGTDTLIRLAVMHYQFEAIHPFVDGNGRTGRVLNLLYLVDKGLLDIPVLYLSRHIVRNQSLYYRHLLEVTTREAWKPWIRFMMEGVRTTAEWTTARIHAISQLFDETVAAVRQRLPKIYSRELVELIFVHPYCRINDVVQSDIAKRPTAGTYLKALAAEGIVAETRAGRENIYINSALMALLADDA